MLLYIFFQISTEHSASKANSGDPDTPCFEASDHGLRCLSMSYKKDVRRRWVKYTNLNLILKVTIKCFKVTYSSHPFIHTDGKCKY